MKWTLFCNNIMMEHIEWSEEHDSEKIKSFNLNDFFL